MNVRYFYSLIILFCCVATISSAQEVDMSLPKPLTYGITNVRVLGNCANGILVYESGKNSNWITSYSTNLFLQWRKEIVLIEKSSSVEDVFLAGDSVIVFYTVYTKGKYILKANLYSSNIGLQKTGFVIDTLPNIFANENIQLSFRQSMGKRNFLVYFTESDFDKNGSIHYCKINSILDQVYRSFAKVNMMQYPEIIDALIDDDNHSFFICGDKQAKNYDNDYQYTEIGIIYNHLGYGNNYVSFKGAENLLGTPVLKEDFIHQRILLCGLYAEDAGNEGKGSFMLNAGITDTIVYYKQKFPFTENFLFELTGEQQLKKSDGYYDFQITDLIIKKDGGVLMITESQTQSSETLGNAAYGGFGTNPAMVINYYHFNDLVVFAIDSVGVPEWYRVLRKKQSSDNDGGYYLSYGLMYGTTSINLFYNDVVNSQHNLSMYQLSVNGDIKREDLLDCDRKNLAPIPLQAKQISAGDYLIPSLRRGFFQLIKISF